MDDAPDATPDVSVPTMSGAAVATGKPKAARTPIILVWAFTFALAAGALLIWEGPVTGLSDVRSHLHLPWVLLAAAFALGHFAAVRVEFRNQSHSLNLADAVLLPAIVFTSPAGVVLAATVGYLVRAAWIRPPVIKAAFNLALHAFVAVVALVTYHAVIGGDSMLSTRGWLAGVAAILVADLISSSAIQVVVGLTAGPSAFVGLRRFGAALIIALVAKASLGLVAVHRLTAGTLSAVVFAITAVTIAVGYVMYGRLRARHARLTQLYQFDRALAGLVERGEVIDAVLTETISLLNAAEAELFLAGPNGTERHTMRSGDAASAPPAGSVQPLVDALAAVSHTVRVTRTTAVHGLGPAMQAWGVRDAIIAPVSGEPGHEAWLVVADRLGGEHVTFQDADIALLDALAVHAAMALRSSLLLDRLRDEVAAKQHQAHHDGLTGLPNRILYSAAVDQAVAERSGDTLVGVLLMDLDGFKAVNDTMGHDVGDLLLQQLATRLAPVVGDKGLIARLGGDEFAVVLPSAWTIREVRTLAEELAAAAETTSTVAGTDVRLRASIGISIGPDHGDDRSTLMRRADSAMYQAKRHGLRVAVYEPRLHTAPVGSPSLVSALREAVDARALDLSYQPKADLRTGRVVGVEALLRWHHPVYGPVKPDQAIPIAERSGLIRALTRWVLDTSLAQLARWRQDGAADLDLAVNLSPVLLADAEIVDEVVGLLRAHRIPAGCLTLELTESLSGARPVDDDTAAQRLVRHGVRLSIDDYGTGMSSLARVSRLPVSELKVDKSFVSEMVTNESVAAIVRSTVELAHRLGLAVVAEGVEARDAWRQLRQMRCDYAQGYLLSPPLPAAELEAWLRHRAPHLARESNVIPIDVAAEYPRNW